MKLFANSTLLHAFLVLLISFALLFVLFARISGFSISLQFPTISAEGIVMLGIGAGTLVMGYMVFFAKLPETLENMLGILGLWFVWLHLYIYAVEIAARLLGV